MNSKVYTLQIKQLAKTNLDISAVEDYFDLLTYHYLVLTKSVFCRLHRIFTTVGIETLNALELDGDYADR